jgi:hypothetical protein
MFNIIVNVIDLNAQDAYVTVYRALYGWKGVLLSKDEDCGGMFTPWTTTYHQYPTRAESLQDALSMAHDEELPFFLCTTTAEEQAIIDEFIENAKLQEEINREEIARFERECEEEAKKSPVTIDPDDDFPF